MMYDVCMYVSSECWMFPLRLLYSVSITRILQRLAKQCERRGYHILAD